MLWSMELYEVAGLFGPYLVELNKLTLHMMFSYFLHPNPTIDIRPGASPTKHQIGLIRSNLVWNSIEIQFPVPLSNWIEFKFDGPPNKFDRPSSIRNAAVDSRTSPLSAKGKALFGACWLSTAFGRWGVDSLFRLPSGMIEQLTREYVAAGKATRRLDHTPSLKPYK